MVEAVRSRLSYANVMATLALFVALGGVGYAAAKLPRDSVGSKQIKEDAVKASEQAPDSVDSGNVIDLSLGGSDLADDSVGSAQISTGAVDAAEVDDAAVGSEEVIDGSLRRADLGPVDLRTPTLEDCSPGTPWQAVSGLPPHYWKDNEGVVHLEGAVQCSVNITGASIFQMPRVVGDIYDPAGGQDLARFATLGAAQSIAQIAIVKNPISTGVVYDAGSAAGTENYVSLDGISYRAAN